MSLSPSKDFAFADNVLKNNILAGSRFVAHDTRWAWYTKELNGKPVQVLAGRLDGFVLERNDLFSEAGDLRYLVTLGGRSPLVTPQRALSRLEKAHPRVFRGNMVCDPGFVNAKEHDYRLRPGSPLIDKGALLTRTAGRGSGTSMPVKDVGYFFDGFGIPGEEGDLIRLAGRRETARIVRIDRKRGVLVLSRALEWTDGQGVAVEFSGAAPDIGAHEFVPGEKTPSHPRKRKGRP